jgi:PhnB protein
MRNRTMPSSTVIPELVYEDVGAAIDWLSDAFGFQERWRAGDHRAHLSYAGGTIAITEPRTSAAPPGPRSLLVRVADAHAHHDRAREHGAIILAAPEDFPYGERQYTAEDLGGHHWTFSESIADVAPEAWGGRTGPALADRPDASLSVMLIVPDADAAVAWYVDALGATRLWDLGGVAGLEVAGAPFFVHQTNLDKSTETSPDVVGVTSTRIEVFLDEPDHFFARAVAAGATVESAITPHEMPWGTHRQGGFRDPFGHCWSVGDRSPLGRHP